MSAPRLGSLAQPLPFVTGPRRLRLGFIVPSSNTAVEPVVTNVINTVNKKVTSVHITTHFSRFRVTQISLDASAQSQFQLDAIVEAASLLADAKVDAIIWAGTSAGWLGLDTDRRLCREITTRFNIPATTSTMALIEHLRLAGNPKLGLVTPYVKDMNAAIVANFAKEGITTIDHGTHLSITDNTAIAEVTRYQLGDMVYDLLMSKQGVNHITIFCTNLNVAYAVKDWEAAYKSWSLVVLDSTTVTVWASLRKLQIETAETGVAAEWGSLFDVGAAQDKTEDKEWDF